MISPAPIGPGAGVFVRRASRDDLHRIQSLAGQIWRAHYPGIISLEQIDYMLERMYSLETMRREIDSGIVYELAEDGGMLIGFLSHEFTPSDRRLKLHKLYLLPEVHGRGHGQAMIHHVIDAAIQAGAVEVFLQVNKQNLKAIRAYERAGFHNKASVAVPIGGGFMMDDFVMSLPLPDHPT